MFFKKFREARAAARLAKMQAPKADLQFDYTLSVAIYQDEIIKLNTQKKVLFEQLKQQPNNNVYQLQFKKVNQKIANFQKLVDMYKNEAVREMLIDGLKEIPLAEKKIIEASPISDEALQLLASTALRAEAKLKQRANVTQDVERRMYGNLDEATMIDAESEGLTFNDPEFLRMLSEEKEQKAKQESNEDDPESGSEYL